MTRTLQYILMICYIRYGITQHHGNSQHIPHAVLENSMPNRLATSGFSLHQLQPQTQSADENLVQQSPTGSFGNNIHANSHNVPSSLSNMPIGQSSFGIPAGQSSFGVPAGQSSFGIPSSSFGSPAGQSAFGIPSSSFGLPSGHSNFHIPSNERPGSASVLGNFLNPVAQGGISGPSLENQQHPVTPQSPRCIDYDFLQRCLHGTSQTLKTCIDNCMSNRAYDTVKKLKCEVNCYDLYYRRLATCITFESKR